MIEKLLLNVFHSIARLSEIEDKLDNLKNMEASVLNNNNVQHDYQEQKQVNISERVIKFFSFMVFRKSS